jgi:hypothetical protein
VSARASRLPSRWPRARNAGEKERVSEPSASTQLTLEILEQAEADRRIAVALRCERLAAARTNAWPENGCQTKQEYRPAYGTRGNGCAAAALLGALRLLRNVFRRWAWCRHLDCLSFLSAELQHREWAKEGRQHSSRIVCCGRSTCPFVCGRPARMRRCSTASAVRAAVKAPARYSERLSVITASSFQPAAASSEATRRTSAEQCRTRGLRGEACSSAQAKLERTSIAVYCQTAPFVPERRPT